MYHEQEEINIEKLLKKLEKDCKITDEEWLSALLCDAVRDT